MNNTQEVLNVKVRLFFLLDNHYKINFVNLYPDTRGVEHK